MAVTKTIQGSTNNSNWTFKTVVTELSSDSANMKWTVRVENFLGRSSSSSYFAGNYDITYKAGGKEYTENLYKNSGTINAGSYVSLGYHDFEIDGDPSSSTILVEGSMSTSDFSPYSASASGSVTLSQLHQYPNPTLGDIVELNSKLITAGIANDYFVNNLSKKSFSIGGETFDNATISKYIVHNGNNLTESNNTPVIIDFSNTPLYYEYSDYYKRNIAPFSVGIKDSFGLSAYAMYDNNYVIPYVKPNLIPTASNVKRNGQLTGKVKLNLTGTYYNGQVGNVSNKINLSYKYWKVGSTEPTDYIEIPSDVYSINGNNISILNWEVAKNGTVISDVDKSSAYKFKIKVVDSFDSISEIELTCSKGEWLMARFKDRIDFKKITVGGTTVIDSGSNENGSWVKFYDGTMICRNTKAFEVTATNALGSALYYGYVADIGYFPQAFIDRPDINFSLHTGSDIFAIQPYDISSVTKENAGGVYAICAQQRTSSATIYISYIAVGKWK